MKVVTKQAFVEVNFGENGPGNLAKQEEYMDLEDALNEEKLVISEMIKSGMFGELFSYLKDKEISTFFCENWTPFPSAEFDALVAESPQHKLTKSISPNTLGSSARQGITGMDATQLHVNGLSAGKVDMGLPYRLT